MSKLKNLMNLSLWGRIFGYLALAFLVAIPVFGHLDTLPIRVWDEARLAVNAYEMLRNGNWIVTHFEGLPDMWNTKPPLLIWIQVLFMKTIGVNELAVRLPSSIAVVLTCVALLIFTRKYLKNTWFGVITVFVLITSQGYLSLHAGRTGDYDALLSLFTTVGGLLFFSFCHTQKPLHLYLFFLFTSLGVLTKSVTGLLFIPAIMAYALISRRFISLIRSRHFYLGLFSSLALVGGYYLLREAYNPGYIQAVTQNELGGRYLEVLEDHHEGYWFYYHNLVNYRLKEWIALLPCGIAIGLLLKDRRYRNLTLFSLLMILEFFLVISGGQTKLEWYDVPMYPFLAILITLFLDFGFRFLANNPWINQTIRWNILPLVFLFLAGIGPYQKILDKTHKPKETGWAVDFYKVSNYLREAIKGQHNLDGQFLLFDGYAAHNRFYMSILAEKGVKVSFKDWTRLEPGDTVFAWQKNVKQYVQAHYNQEIVSRNGLIVTYKILERSENPKN